MRRAGSQRSGKFVDDFRVFREASGGVFRVNQFAVDDDIEHTFLTLDQFDLGAEPVMQCRRQTDSARLIASKDAVGDRGLHCLIRTRQAE